MNEPSHRIDVAANSGAQKWTRREQVGRALWGYRNTYIPVFTEPVFGYGGEPY